MKRTYPVVLHPRDSFQPMQCLSSLNVNQRSLLLCGIYLDTDGRHLTRQPPMRIVNINIQILHSNPKRKIKRYRKDTFQSNSFETLQLQRCKMDEIQLFSREDLNEWEVQSLVPIQRRFSLFDGDLAKLNLINKSKILHGLYSYRP